MRAKLNPFLSSEEDAMDMYFGKILAWGLLVISWGVVLGLATQSIQSIRNLKARLWLFLLLLLSLGGIVFLGEESRWWLEGGAVLLALAAIIAARKRGFFFFLGGVIVTFLLAALLFPQNFDLQKKRAASPAPPLTRATVQKEEPKGPTAPPIASKKQLQRWLDDP